MDLTRAYHLSPAVQSRLRLLDWISDNGGKAPGAFVDLGPLFEGQDQEGAMAVAGTLEALEDEGLLRLQKTLGWAGWSGDVTPSGLDLIEELQTRRGDRL